MIAVMDLESGSPYEEADNSGVRFPYAVPQNGLNSKPFRFLDAVRDTIKDTTLGKYINYTPPKLYKGKDRWWIFFKYRIPENLRHLHDGKKWKRIKVYEDLNVFKNDEYAALLLDAVKTVLERGYDPFASHKKFNKEKQQGILETSKKDWSCIQAFNLFRMEWEKRGLEDATLTKLYRAIDLMVTWLKNHNLLQEPVTKITKKWVQLALDEESQKGSWSKRTFNNNVSALSTVFRFFLKEKMIQENPTTDITRKRTKAQKHKFYDTDQFDGIREVMQREDPLLFFAAKLVYYLCIRSEKELKLFKVGNIFLDRRQVLIQAEDAKMDADRFISIPDELMEELTAIRKNYPAHFYVIGKGARVKHVKENTPSPKPFVKNMLSARFMKIRRKVPGVTSDHTIYSFKHTRIIHLKLDGGRKVTDADLMQLTGHTSYQAFAEYLRDLGIAGNPETINTVGRKF